MVPVAFAMFLACCIALGAGHVQTDGPKGDPTSKPASKRRQPPAKSVPPHRTDLTGRAFAITRSGDLKEARFAQVFILSGNSAAQFNAEILKIQSKLADAEAKFEALRLPEDGNSDSNRLNSGPNRRIDTALKILCDTSVSKPRDVALDLAKAHPDQVLILETNEDGFFKIGGLKPGPYTVVVVGRAGANNAAWVENITIELGKDLDLKMRTPLAACFDL